MSTKEVLQKARALITDPRCFLTGRLLDGKGAYCAVGAVVHATRVEGCIPTNDFDRALSALAAPIASRPMVRDPHHGDPHLVGREKDDNWARVVNFNNTMGHECVLKLFDTAIEKIERVEK